MTDQTTEPLDLDAIRADLDARVPARDLGDRNHARALIEEVERLRAATVKPDQEAAARAFWNGYEHPETEREGFDAGIEAVWSLLPGRTEAEVKAEALREAADQMDADPEFRDPLRLRADWLRARADRIEKETDRG